MRIAFFSRVAKSEAFLGASAIFAADVTFAQQVPEQLYSEMKWRMIGPFRAGKVNAIAGVPGNPGVYYFEAVGGGVWKTTDGGTGWKLFFYVESVASFGAMDMVPSDTNI